MNAGARRWTYSAEDAKGAVVSGVVVANDLDGAKGELQARRLTPLRLSPERLDALSALNRNSGKTRLSLTELSEIAARLRDLLGAGIPIAHALRLAGEQATRPKERAFLQQLLGDVRAGRTLSDALARNDFETPRLFRALIEAGESLGALGSQMGRLATHYDDALKLRREIVSQLVYPAALVVLIIATLFFLSFLVLPQFEGIFEASDAAPPPETRFVLAAGAAIRAWWPFAPALASVIVVAVRFLARRYARRFELARIKAPIAGKALLYAEFGVYLRTLATLLGGGAPLARAMPLARQTLSLSHLQTDLDIAERAVRTGERLAPALKRLTTCPRELLSFIEIGEETGDLARLAAEAATRAETQVRQAIRRFMMLLAPVLTALMGLLTAGVIAAVMTGVLSLNETIE